MKFIHPTQPPFQLWLVGSLVILFFGFGFAQRNFEESSLVPIRFSKPAKLPPPEQIKPEYENLDATILFMLGVDKRCSDQKESLDWSPGFPNFEEEFKKKLADLGLIYVPLKASSGVQPFKIIGTNLMYGYWFQIKAGVTSQGVRFPFFRLSWCGVEIQ